MPRLLVINPNTSQSITHLVARLVRAAVGPGLPRQQFGGDYLHGDLLAMAAAYLFHIAQNHPFVDGNKRAAVLSALVCFSVNGIEELPDPKGWSPSLVRSLPAKWRRMS